MTDHRSSPSGRQPPAGGAGDDRPRPPVSAPPRGPGAHDTGRGQLAPFRRPRFFAGQILDASDLESGQDYHREKALLRSRLLHGSGTVCGLAVDPTDPPTRSVLVQPGVALDSSGREIVVPSATTLALEREPSSSARDESVLLVTVAYAEAHDGSVSGDLLHDEPAPPGDPMTQPTRTVEGYELALRRAGAADTHRRVVAPGPQAIREAGPDGIHRLLCEYVIRSCPPATDESLVLAAVTVPATEPITAEHIDNSVRPIVVTADLLEALVHAVLAHPPPPPDRS